MRPLIVVGVLLLLALACSTGGSFSGDLLVLTRPTGLVEHAIESSDERKLVSQEQETLLLEPAVSPDGSQIAYVRQLTPIVLPGQSADFGSDLFIVSRDGGSARLLLEHEARGDLVRSPAWLPDGTSLVVSLQHIERGRVFSTLERLEIASGQRTVLVEDAFQPAVSPDGSLLVYVRNEQDFSQTLWISDLDGGNGRQVAGTGGDIVSFYSPRFSPDGSAIAFGGAEPLAPTTHSLSSWLVAAAPAAPRPAANEAPVFNGLPADIWTLDIASGALQKIADVDLDQPSLTWSSDGSNLYVLSTTALLAIDLTGEAAPEAIGEGMFHGYVDWLGGD